MSKYLRLFGLVMTILVVLVAGSTVLADTTLASTFTYQGFLSNNGTPVTDNACAFKFELYSVASGGTKIGSTLTPTTAVSGGVFTVQLDFGAAAFDGNDRYLDIQVNCPSVGVGNIQLTPRSPVTSAPSAIIANGLTALTIQSDPTSPNLIGGFSGNVVAGGIHGATIGGGGASGAANQINGNYGTVGGGVTNTASGVASFVGGGESNSANSLYSTVAGGNQNTANNQFSFVGGGFQNNAGGEWSTIPGGNQNTAGGNYSFAAGNNAHASNIGSFVWNDSTGVLATPLTSSANNQFLARASGGVTFLSSATGDLDTGVTLATGSGTWASASDRNLKANLETVDPRTILSDVVSMPVSTWNYIAQGDSIRHIGPMAQDFYATFGLGEDDKHIGTVDADGVALAAIQGLYQVVQDKDAQITTLQTENAELKTRLDDLDQRLSALEALAAPSQAGVGLPAMLMGVVLLGGLGFAGRRVLRKDATL